MLPNFNQVQAEEDTTRVIKQLQTLDRDEALGVAASMPTCPCAPR